VTKSAAVFSSVIFLYLVFYIAYVERTTFRDSDKDFVYSLSRANMYDLVQAHGGWDDQKFRDAFARASTVIIEQEMSRSVCTSMSLKMTVLLTNLQVSPISKVGHWRIHA